MTLKTLAALVILATPAPAALPALADSPWTAPATPAPAHETQAPEVEATLKVFDKPDFDVFSNQKWDELGESHADDIAVTWPDGHETRAIQRHIEDLKALFVFAADIKVAEHPIRFGSGSFTTATGVMTGTFSQPMPIGAGKTIPATGKSFALGMGTLATGPTARWITNGCSGTMPIS